MEQHTLLLAASPSQQPQQHVLPKSKGQLVPDSRRIGDTRQRCIVQGRKQKRLPHRTVTTILTDEPKHIQQTQQVIFLKPLQSLVFLNLVEHLDQTVELFEPLHETITMPLLFMKTTITAAFINLVAEGLLLVSDMNTQYIMLIVDHILARSYKVSANALKRASAHNEHYRASQQHLKNAVPPNPEFVGLETCHEAFQCVYAYKFASKVQCFLRRSGILKPKCFRNLECPYSCFERIHRSLTTVGFPAFLRPLG
jgi:hypothetical protein